MTEEKIETEEIVKPSDVLLETPAEPEKKKRGRKPGSKKKDDLQAQAFEKLLDEFKSLKGELEDTKKKLDEVKRDPVSVRLEQSKKKRRNIPQYTGPTKRVKFMRNDQPENPMNSRLTKVVFNKETEREELVDWTGTLTPGRTYELPEPVVDFLNSRTEPTYSERSDPENPRQTITQIIGEKQRCYCIPA